LTARKQPGMRINRIRVELLFGSRGFFHESHAFSPFPCGAYNRRCRPNSGPSDLPVVRLSMHATLTACPEGSFPNGLIEGADGNFYGITIAGGTGLNSLGTVFQITPGGVLTVLFQLCRAARRQPARRRRAHQFGRRYGRLPLRHHAPGWRQRGGNRIQE
jgi:uncharacterized repeat protein (TIGR03803 family)